MSTKEINNHIVWAIVSVFMFWPAAIPAILHAFKVNKAIKQGDMALAMQESAVAKKWCKVSLIVWIVLMVLSISGVIIAMSCVSKAAYGYY